jgi:hypothetical protein
VPDVPDIHEPVPDLGHESLRQSVVAALDGIEEQVARLERVFLLLKGTGHALQGTLNVLVGAQATQSQVQQALTAQAEQIAALQAAVDALTPGGLRRSSAP